LVRLGERPNGAGRRAMMAICARLPRFYPREQDAPVHMPHIVARNRLI
jgi:hypothetical protein